MANFNKLDRILGVADAGTSLEKILQREWVEDQAAANDDVAAIYENLGLKRPKPVWAKSPRVIHEAIEMLRNIHVGQRHQAIEALVPYNDDTLRREAQKTLLEAIIERDLTVTMGAPVSKQFPYGNHFGLDPLPWYLARALRPLNLGKQTAAAGWADAVLYSIGIPSVAIREQTFCILPYVKIAWMCSPAQKIVDEEKTVWRWADGYTVFIPHEEPEEEDQTKILGDPTKPITSLVDHAAKVGKLLEGK